MCKWTVGVLVLVLAIPSAVAQNSRQTLRIGVYDSRAVALAYYNSEPVRKEMQQMFADLKNAKETGDQEKIAELQTRGPALQSLMHQQVFGCLSIPNITPKLGDTFAAAAKAKQLAMIVSRWDVGYKDPAIEYIDVTADLVNVFKPDERVQKWLAEMSTKDPLPINQLLSMRPEQ